MHQQQQDQAGQELERIYAKLLEMNRATYEYKWLTEDDLALIRWAFGINTH